MFILALRTVPWQFASLPKLVVNALIEDDAKAALEKRVAELERSNAQLKLDLEHANEALQIL
jgi:hypothetical protein